jgi:methylenetetrahydrofolate reductase (NADPH)
LVESTLVSHEPQQPADLPLCSLSQAVVSLTFDYTLEVTPREVRKNPGLLQATLPVGTRVYITFLANSSFDDTVAAAAGVLEQGMRPVPHLAARSVRDVDELDHMIARLTEVGVDELLLIAGSLSRPAGGIDESMQVLRSGVLERRGIGRVGVAGHPEGNKDIGDTRLDKALAEKNAFAASSGVELYLLTQFCFAAEPIVTWERRIRLAGNSLPVHVGLPGLSSPTTLLKFGLSCGIGPSLKVLRKQSGGLLKLAAKPIYYPDQTLVGLGRAIQEDPDSLVHAAHFFPFGALESTAAWNGDINAGRFELDDTQGRLEVTG